MAAFILFINKHYTKNEDEIAFNLRHHLSAQLIQSNYEMHEYYLPLIKNQ